MTFDVIIAIMLKLAIVIRPSDQKPYRPVMLMMGLSEKIVLRMYASRKIISEEIIVDWTSLVLGERKILIKKRGTIIAVQTYKPISFGNSKE